jgi:hypothetical protein
MKIDPNRHQDAIRCDPGNGPTFGQDFYIYNNFNTTMVCFSQLGDSYKHPQYVFRTNEAKSFLVGSYKFQFDEIEVYQKE